MADLGLGLHELKRAFDELGTYTKIMLMVPLPFIICLLNISLVAVGMSWNLHWTLTWLLTTVPNIVCTVCVILIILKRRKLLHEWKFENIYNENATDELIELLKRQQKKKKNGSSN